VLGERDQSAEICYVQSGKRKGRPEPDPLLSDTELVPFGWGEHPKSETARVETITDFFETLVKPHVPDAWVDFEKTKVGYEIPFNRHFYTFEPPRPLAEIDEDLNKVVVDIMEMLREVEQ
jgi:type I restriction enzyme M protein